MKTVLLFGAAMAALLAGCSDGETWPPTLNEVEADLGYPPRGQAYVVIDRGSVITNLAVAYPVSPDRCGLYIGLLAPTGYTSGGGLSFYSDVCRRSVSEQLALGARIVIAGYQGAPPQRHRLVNDSTIQGVMAGTLQAAGLWVGTSRVMLTYTAAGPPLPEGALR